MTQEDSGLKGIYAENISLYVKLRQEQNKGAPIKHTD